MMLLRAVSIATAAIAILHYVFVAIINIFITVVSLIAVFMSSVLLVL